MTTPVIGTGLVDLADWPKPEVRSRTPEFYDPIPVNASRAEARARDHGWSTRLTYARGTVPNKDGQPGPVVDHVQLKAMRGGMLVAMAWEDGKARHAWLLVWGDPMPINHTQARAILETPA